MRKAGCAMCFRGACLLGMAEVTALCAIQAISFALKTGILEAFLETDVRQVLKALLMPKLDLSSVVIYSAFYAYLIWK